MSKWAFVFPGQGSQQVGMGRDFYENLPACRQVFEEASRILGLDIAALCFEGPEERLRDTQNAQPALFVVSMAALKAIQPLELKPAFVAGHSIGEYAALVACGAADFETALRLVGRRAALMAQAGQTASGSMAAILGLTDEEAKEICKEASSAGIVVVANYNCPGQVVISGQPSALERAAILAKERGARRILPLNVSGGFHSPLMQSAASVLAKEIVRAPFSDPKIPLIANVTARPAATVEEIRKCLSDQMAGSVLWERSVRYMISKGVERFVELGAGEVLCGLIRRIDKSVQAFSVQNMASLDALRS